MAKGKDRDRQLEMRWRRIIREHARSRVTVREFCREKTLVESTFYFWRRELQRRAAESEQLERPSAQAAFLPVRLAENVRPTAASPIVIELPDRRRVHVTVPVDRAALADVLAVLRLDESSGPGRIEREASPC